MGCGRSRSFLYRSTVFRTGASGCDLARDFVRRRGGGRCVGLGAARERCASRDPLSSSVVGVDFLRSDERSAPVAASNIVLQIHLFHCVFMGFKSTIHGVT
ncbi:hypothetical protein BRADI_4g33505v3 [Brachypodium distachyon]|uniref:Uncharacterized protein n=1 Tax=Brachypodium distachyon TaxID=15368 RepID=A0A0Q3EWI4_BRADI|nr:hypothetical protein BRADI_4g33505v3 [Brachypodium distachyon]PNT64823.1 hypothetical protein BRADI_4g33505v3 [Brachypodium distachyon]